MKKIVYSLAFVTAIPLLASCQKKSTPEVPIQTYTVKLDMRPSVNNSAGAPTSIDTSKKIYLSLGTGQTFGVGNAATNAALIDLAIYDGSTTSSSIGDIHFVSPGGGTLSFHTAPSVYLYLKPGTTDEGMQFFELTNMAAWSKFNKTAIRDQSGMNGFDAAEFDAMDNLREFNAAVSKVKQPGTDNSNQAKKVLQIDEDKLTSTVWFFEYQSGGGTKTAFAKIINHQYQPDGYITLQVKIP